MFVRKTDFDVVPYSIPNLDAEINSFNTYVDREEAGMLKSLLGITLYNSFIAGLAVLPSIWNPLLPTVIDQEYVYINDVWKALTVQTGTVPIVGVDWELVEAGNKWLKLKNGAQYYMGVSWYEWVGMSKMLTPYIFSMWLRDTFDNNSGIGVVVAKGENSKVINPSKRIARAYNDFSHLCGNRHEQCGTLYGFLTSEGELGTWVDAYSGTDFSIYFSRVFNSPGRMNFMNL
jgi:hypothetical protein